MESASYFETSAPAYQTKRHNVKEIHNLNNYWLCMLHLHSVSLSLQDCSERAEISLPYEYETFRDGIVGGTQITLRDGYPENQNSVPGRTNNLSFLFNNVQTRSEAHLTTCPLRGLMLVLFTGAKRPRCEASDSSQLSDEFNTMKELWRFQYSVTAHKTGSFMNREAPHFPPYFTATCLTKHRKPLPLPLV
jgi:hypothetical protein